MTKDCLHGNIFKRTFVLSIRRNQNTKFLETMNTNTTAAKKLTFAFFTSKAKESMRIARELFAQKAGKWATCLKMAWKKIKALATQTITFAKVESFHGLGTPEIVTRNILPIESLTGFNDSDKKFPGLFRMIDADKFAKTGDAKASIISCYLQKVM